VAKPLDRLGAQSGVETAAAHYSASEVERVALNALPRPSIASPTFPDTIAREVRQPRGPMSIPFAQFLVGAVYVYLGIGVIVMLWMQFGGLRRVDKTAERGTVGFRILITPGLVLLWPLVLKRAIRAAGHPPVESGPHRDAAKGDGS
jgi:hypothetical protein